MEYQSGMEKSVSALSRSGSGPNHSGAVAMPDLNLLLVSRNPDWFAAVTGATGSSGHVDVLTCSARDALARLAGTVSNYSHLLIDRNDADGPLDELADLATEVAASDMDMLVLGAADSRYPRIRFIPTA